MLSNMFRQVAITGGGQPVYRRIADRQGEAWAQRTVGAAMAPTFERAEHDAARKHSLETLEDLHARGAVTDAEFEALRARL